ncbi:MAG: HAD family phosphatase [Armatimonadetes bacterium]|nr:HAD family phosphatase [Armatimonadota bacterium]
MSLDAVFFDFDGLILDTETPEVIAWQHLYADHGLEFPDEIWQRMIGEAGTEIGRLPLTHLERMLGRPINHAELEEANRIKRHAMIEQQPVMPGVQELLQELRARFVPLAVVSSSRHPWVFGHLSRLGLVDYFQALICRSESLPTKPAPDLYLAAKRQFGPQAVAIEDSPKGIAAAKAAGLRCFAVPNSLTKQLDLSGADRVFNSVGEITYEELSRW